MLRRLARRSARMPDLASRSSDMGSMPFWLITTKPSPPLHTCQQAHGVSQQACFKLACVAGLQQADIPYGELPTLPAWGLSPPDNGTYHSHRASGKQGLHVHARTLDLLAAVTPLQRHARCMRVGARTGKCMRARTGNHVHLVLQVDDALHALVRDGALRRDQLLALLRAAVEEAAVHLRMSARFKSRFKVGACRCEQASP